jgi:hypothetical protein
VAGNIFFHFISFFIDPESLMFPRIGTDIKIIGFGSAEVIADHQTVIP